MVEYSLVSHSIYSLPGQLMFLEFSKVLFSDIMAKLSVEKFVTSIFFTSIFYIFIHLSNINILLQIYFKSGFINHFISLEIEFYNMTDHIAILTHHFRWEAIKNTSSFTVLVSFTICYVKPLKFLNFHNDFSSMNTLMFHVMLQIPQWLNEDRQ